MANDLDSQGLLEAFFDALRLRDLERCRSLLRSLEALSRQQPNLKPTCTYMEGILAFEDDRDWAEAERTFTALLQTDLEPAVRAQVLYALGRSLDVQGRWEEAIAAFEQSLSISTQLRQTIEQAKAWKHIAISYRKGFTQGDFGPQALQQAIEYYHLALGALEPIPDPAPDVAWLKGSVWNGLGLAYRDLGWWDEAISCYQQDLAICRSQGDRHGMGLTYGNLGEVYQKRGNWPQALEAYQQALTIIREFDDRYEEAEALANLAFLHQEMREYERALDYYRQAIDLIEGLRAGVSAEEARVGFFATVVDTYANAVLLCLETGDRGRAFDIVERARARAFLDTLAAGLPDLPGEKGATTMTLAEVQAALPDDALLLEYFTTGLIEARDSRSAAPPGVQRHRFPPARTLIFAVTHDEVRVHDACLSPNDLLPRRLDSVVERHFLEPQIRRTLYGRLVAPIEGFLQDRQRLYLVPHGPLHYIPFQALIAPNGETLLREETPALVYAPSATILFRHASRQTGPSLGTCMAIGYNNPEGVRLCFAEEEARSIAQLTGGTALVGPSPKKATLYSQAGNCRLLHFSCHGEFDPQIPLASALHLAPGEALTALDVLEHLHLCCDLVTLSACESGLSRVRRGDELIGLIRAFMHAGAPALVSTLWRVDERSTLILMERFYREIQAGMSLAQALKRAQLHLKNLTRQEALAILTHLPNDRVGTSLAEEDKQRIFADPYYWAPFVLVGGRESGTLRG